MELMFLKKLMLKRQANQKSVIFAIILDKGFKFQPSVCIRCHDLLIMSIGLSDIAILKIKDVD